MAYHILLTAIKTNISQLFVLSYVKENKRKKGHWFFLSHEDRKSNQLLKGVATKGVTVTLKRYPQETCF